MTLEPDAVAAPAGHVPLAPFSTLEVGGTARWFVEAATVPAIRTADAWASARDVAMFVLGGGSNLVIADEGFDGLVVRIALEGLTYESSGDDVLVHAGAGLPWDAVVAETVARGLAGLECLSGIPGTVGGTPVQNVGAYGQEVSDVIDRVGVFDRLQGVCASLTARECGFGYRTSRFKGADAARFVVTDVCFRLQRREPCIAYADLRAELVRDGIDAPGLAEVRRAVLGVRRRKGMVLDPQDPDTRSVGSFFMNPVVTEDVYGRIAGSAGKQVPGYASPGGVKVPAAWLIEEAGFARGYRRGAVRLSSKHTLAIVNSGGATARDVIGLAVEIKRGVMDRFDVALRPEPNFVGFAADAEIDYLTGA